MTYGLGTRALIEIAPRSKAGESESGLHAQGWRSLDPDRRLRLVDRALNPANDLINAYPLAL